MGSRPRKTTTTRRREKREERREKSEERRERREETREKTEDRPQEAARGPQMRPPEGGQPFSWPCRPGVGALAASRAEGRKQKEQRRYPKRGRQKSPNEAAREGPTLFLAMPPGAGTSGGFKGRGRRAEKRKKREETRENMFFLLFFIGRGRGVSQG